ncbi:major facilitator superfamily protein [Actinidia rufa]|uniref:Major facilitator superfamily protein n=1 Tax=Actinidia rufa TaxID=165716 RepID=A0A7J0FWB5_9ERIC|nr:major facilitator superfamily protein [Actinidia rufa]
MFLGDYFRFVVTRELLIGCLLSGLLPLIPGVAQGPSVPDMAAAAVMLSGQIADGFTTIFAGELIDRFGHFKIWHGAGSALVAVSFSSVFGGCLLCKILGSNSSTLQTIGYSMFAAIFNVGWAATQVSHMSMVNCITLNSISRVVLASCRNAFTMVSTSPNVANLSLYAVAFVVFHVSTSKTIQEVENQYRWIAYSSIVIGCCFVGIFYLGTKEPRLKQGVEGKSYARISWAYWFNKVLYFQVALIYVLTRLVTNVSQAFLAFYVIDDLQMAQSSKALVPAIIYICSFIVSVLLQVISVSMQSVLVGEDLNGCAFVYGSLSFMDKMSCGLALYILESYQDTSPNLHGCSSMTLCFSVSRNGVGLIPAICAAVGLAVTSTMELHTTNPKPLMEPLLA